MKLSETAEIQDCINSLLSRYANHTGSFNPPINPSVLAQLQNAIIIYTRGSIGWVASVMPMGSGFVINIDKSLPKTMRRYAICHEVAHTFFFDTSYTPPRRIKHGQPDQLEERLCFWTAREMLVPTSLLKRESRGIGWEQITIENILKLAKTFEAPPDVILSQLNRIEKKRA